MNLVVVTLTTASHWI